MRKLNKRQTIVRKASQKEKQARQYLTYALLKGTN